MEKLMVVICSTRPGRQGAPVAHWFHELAISSGKFEVELVDLAKENLPLFDETNHPSQQMYERAHTKAWSAKVQAADAFVFVTPEYNFSPPPSLVNALDYLYREWNYKPAAFVSYGGMSGGMRSVEIAKHMCTTLKMVPIVEAVNVQGFAQLIKEGVFQANDGHKKAAELLLSELARWAKALKAMRS